MNLEKHIEKRLQDLFEVIKLLDQGIREEQEIDMEKALLIKAKHKENPGLKASDVQSQVADVMKASRRYYLKTQQILQLIPVLIELKTLSQLFNLKIEIPEEDKAFFESLVQKNQSLYAVEKGKLVMTAPEIEKEIDLEFERLSNEPQGIEMMFNSIISRPEFKG